MNNKKNASSGGLGLSGILGIVFIILKLVGVINWSWFWVLSPFWIGPALIVLIFIVLYCYYKLDEKKYKIR